MILYRAMCKKEFDKISDSFPLSWNSRTKFFTNDLNFLFNRVLDGKFNNSKFKLKYQYIVFYEVNCLNNFIKVSNFEFMLYRNKQPLTSFKILKVLEIL